MKIFSTYIFILLSSLVLAQDTVLVCMHEDLEIASLDALNTKSIEFSPVYYADGLVFVVARERNSILDPKTGQAYFDLMYTDIGPNGTVTRPESFSSNIRTQYHEGPCTFSKQGDEIFFTRSDLTGNTDVNDKKAEVQLKIYHGIKGAEDWEQIEELPFSSTEYSIAHPALSANGHFLVFSSDMPGGFGGMDLYVTQRNGDQWSIPVNLGATVNSKGHDIFPFWHESGYLFFSSDGHGGFGGLDVFVTSWNDSQSFKGIQHLLFPYNSGRDDLGFIVSADGKSGYFASDRKPTKGKDDLYRWTSPESIFCSPAAYQPVLVEKEILVTNDAGDAVSSAYIWVIPMGLEGPSMHRELFNTELVAKPDDPGSFYLRWGVTDTLSIQTADGVTGSSGRVNIKVDNETTYAIVVQHDDYLPYVNVITGENIPAYIRLTHAPTIPVNCFNTLFSIFNTAGDERLNGAKIQLTSQCLKNVVNLVANEDGNAATCLPAGCAVKAEILHEGYAPHSFTFSPSEEDEHWTIYLKSSADLTAPPAPIASGTIIVLDNIYYDFNKSAIRKSDAGELTALANILKQYPDLTIELTSHTDTRGTSDYNMELSQKRSESSKNYLMLLGINGSRIVTRASGESMPRNHCLDGVPCTESEHQYNRRTEVRIINPAQGMEIRYKASDQ
ncbi:MAG TPA: OmpA family protein [Saprospiraceae bacterium]|nr:OmpA family protein [Saprospiraceae bacterium]